MLHTLPPFEKSLPMLLLRAREASMRQFRPILSEHGVTEQQWRVIRTLADLDEWPASDLAERCALLPPSLTRILKTLSESGVISTRSDDNDRRRVLVSVTPKGRRLIQEVAPQVEAAYAQMDDHLGEHGLGTLIDQLDTLITSLGD